MLSNHSEQTIKKIYQNHRIKQCMQYEAQKFIRLLTNKLTELQANEVSVTFGFKP